ncbi:MHYT domain-containing protein [Cryptosporangium arvum]|uniref:MHYT domain-containing protein n=1 Tax=Cryptosporangium arvum TaxID=80871 RepID=UPI001470441D|nr:MHYT domain-containing protein [Cryptosporangium arvum]
MPALAYSVSVLGSLLGLVCMARSRQSRLPAKRYGWLALSAVSIGGTGIWMMHFLAMLGFAVDGSEVRFAVFPTLFSAFLAVVVVGIGLLILGTGELRLWRVLVGGVFAGLGVAGMHYTGMAAIRLDGTVGYDLKYVALSLVIAVVAASAALWFTVVARNLWLVTGAALIMGVAVNGMHYVGMAAAKVTLDDTHSSADGADVTTALPIIAGLAGVIVVVLLYSALSTPIDEEMRSAESRLGLAGGPGADSESFWTPKSTGQPQPSGPGSTTGSWADAPPAGRPQPWTPGTQPSSGPNYAGPNFGGPAPAGSVPGGADLPWRPGAAAPDGSAQWPGGAPAAGPAAAEDSRWAVLRQKPADQQTGNGPWADTGLADAARRRNASDSW